MRVFIAIDIKEQVKTAIADLQQKIAEQLKNKNGVKWVGPENIHLTLKFLGEIDEGRLDSVADAVRAGCGEKKSFSFEMENVGTFGRPNKIIWLGCEKLDARLAELAFDIEKQLVLAGFEKETRGFIAHLTIGRVRDKGINKNLGKILSVPGWLQVPMIKVDSACVYKSQLTSAGPIYTLLKKIELKSPV